MGKVTQLACWFGMRVTQLEEEELPAKLSAGGECWASSHQSNQSFTESQFLSRSAKSNRDPCLGLELTNEASITYFK
jgi:hypothetical protein